MGVVTPTTLQRVQELFPSYNLLTLEPTSDGVVDTTYIVSNRQKSYILKHFERDISAKIIADTKLLSKLFEANLNVPILLASNKGWYLYKKLDGTLPTWINAHHIVSLARFMAKMHSLTKKMPSSRDFMKNYDIKGILSYTKKHHYGYFKKLSFLEDFEMHKDGLIHGDIFKDNCVYEGSTLGIFDFIDSGDGEFLFDVAVALSAFNPKNSPLFLNLFLKTYNQKAPKKLKKEELKAMIESASAFYALLRIEKYKNCIKAKELL
jgi:homoserine kinase type II